MKGKLVRDEWAMGDVYEGDINKEFQREGKGMMKFANGDKYEGQWAEDNMHGQGEYRCKNGDYYKGEFFRGKKQGYGQYFHMDTKDMYEGLFSDDERYGEGVLYMADGTEKRGNWRGMQISGKVASEKGKSSVDIAKVFQWGKGSHRDNKVNQLLINNI